MIDKKGTVAVWVVIMMPLFLLSIILPTEVGNWAVNKRRLQQTADSASRAGIMAYHNMTPANNSPNPENQKETIGQLSATALIALNTNSSDMTATYQDGIVNPANTALLITITRHISPIFIQNIVNVPVITISASSTAELVSNAGSCVNIDPYHPTQAYRACQPAIVQ